MHKALRIFKAIKFECFQDEISLKLKMQNWPRTVQNSPINHNIRCKALKMFWLRKIRFPSIENETSGNLKNNMKSKFKTFDIKEEDWKEATKSDNSMLIKRIFEVKWDFIIILKKSKRVKYDP